SSYPLKNINYEIYDSEVLRTDEDVAANGGVEISNYGIKAYNTDPLLVFDLNISAGTLDLIANLNVKSGNDVTIDGGELTLWNTAHTTQYIDISGTGIEVKAAGDVVIDGGELSLWNTGHTTKYAELSGTGLEIFKGGDITLESVTGGSTLADRGSLIFPVDSNTFYIASDYDDERLSFYPSSTGDSYFQVGYNYAGVSSTFKHINMNSENFTTKSTASGSDYSAYINNISTSAVANASIYSLSSSKNAIVAAAVSSSSGYIRLDASDYVRQTAANGDPGSGVVTLNGQSVIYVSGANVYLRYKDYSGTARNIQLG
ncbi:MAG: hypothetical protein GY865_06870, partial [candidate division Zixibacteria bacterium]|nr:hypothetical protein [candidate division Zixibacteria bacterium]